MSEDKGNEEDKFGLTPEGERYISLDEACVLALRTASASPGSYGSRHQGVVMVFEVAKATETDGHYMVTLSARPQDEFVGTPGLEQFLIGKDGTIADLQVLSLPTRTLASPPNTGRTGGLPVLPVAIGLVVVGIIAAVGGILLISSSGGDAYRWQRCRPLRHRLHKRLPLRQCRRLHTQSPLWYQLTPYSLSLRAV